MSILRHDFLTLKFKYSDNASKSSFLKLSNTSWSGSDIKSSALKLVAILNDLQLSSK